jgi:hypothetical protein
MTHKHMYKVYVAQSAPVNGKTVIWRPLLPPPTLFALGQPAGRIIVNDRRPQRPVHKSILRTIFYVTIQ